jgi:uncharacterized membrane protein YgcG
MRFGSLPDAVHPTVLAKPAANAPRMVNFTGVPEGMAGNQYYGGGLSQIEEQRQALAQAAGFPLAAVKEPFGGAAYVLDKLGQRMSDTSALSAEKATREQLASIMGGIDLTAGPTQQDIAAAYAADPEYGKALYAQAVAARGKEHWVIDPSDPTVQINTVNGERKPVKGSGITIANTPENKGMTKFEEAKAAKLVDTLGGYTDAGVKAQSQLDDIAQLEKLLQGGMPTGASAKLIDYFQKEWGVSLGEGADKVAAFQSIISRMAPNMRPTGSGPMSDQDMRGFLQSLPNLAATPEGNAQIIARLRQLAAYNQDVGRIASDALQSSNDPNEVQKYFTTELRKLQSAQKPLTIDSGDGGAGGGGGGGGDGSGSGSGGGGGGGGDAAPALPDMPDGYLGGWPSAGQWAKMSPADRQVFIDIASGKAKAPAK